MVSWRMCCSKNHFSTHAAIGGLSRTHMHRMILKLILKVFPLPLFPDVCTAADGVESLCVGLENGHSHCAHRPVQHSKVGGARVWEWECVYVYCMCVCQRESMSFASQTSTHSTFLLRFVCLCAYNMHVVERVFVPTCRLGSCEALSNNP